MQFTLRLASLAKRDLIITFFGFFFCVQFCCEYEAATFLPRGRVSVR